MNKKLTVEKIVINYLKSIKADGLCNPDIECGCGLDDLFPCGEIHDCIPAKMVKPPENWFFHCNEYSSFYTPLEDNNVSK